MAEEPVQSDEISSWPSGDRLGTHESYAQTARGAFSWELSDLDLGGDSDMRNAWNCRLMMVIPDAVTDPRARVTNFDALCAKVLVLPKSPRWREAVSTALVGGWYDEDGQDPIAYLKAESRALHRQLVPLWRRGNRHGRVLSLDADLGGVSLHDLIAADVDLLARTSGGDFEDERLNRVLRSLDRAERRALFAYAQGDVATWAEAAAAVGASDPAAFAERVRRKVKRLAAEQRRRGQAASLQARKVEESS
ncbi:hypothetical protein ACFWFU_24395 [Streptomyces sp. NPDC060235]|uniref:hypothetical protein n=1 Tax=Streptomyces sp. NPDC060235 TaxID=3347080 RepID=UPI00365FCD04